MEKQPVDELFARILGDMEIQPSDAAFTLLKARQKEKHLLVNWGYWAAAACLILIGSFMWWALGATVSTTSKRLAVAKVEPVKGPSRKVGEVLAYRAQSQLSSAGNISTNKPKESKTAVSNWNPILKAQYQKVNRQLMADVQQKELHAQITKESELTAPTSNTGLTLSAVKEVPRESLLPSSERTLIVTIEASVTADQPALAEVAPKEEATDHKGGLSILLQKVKKIKKGENLALDMDKTQHHGLSKLYDEVKESIKNNSIN